MKPAELVQEILRLLKKEYPDPGTSLHFNNPFELLVATILSAQTTDVHINKVTENLFSKYKSIKEYAEAPSERFQKDVSSVNFYKTKARNIQEAARMIINRFNSEVPTSMDDLIELPGVARKTANIVLFNAFGMNEGIAVDTHVKRVAFRLGLTIHEDPLKIERDLMAVTPRKDWGILSHLLILHGRTICQAKKPKHKDCILYNVCPSRDL